MDNNILDNFDQATNEDLLIEEANLLQTIWLQPTATLRYILQHCPEKYMTLFFVFGGIAAAIDRASSKNMGDDLSMFYLLAIAIITGALFGWITYYLYAWAISATGTWLDGKGTPAHFRTVIAWSLVPRIAGLVLLLPEILFFGENLFRSDVELTYSFNSFLLIFFGLLELALGIWSIVILVKGIQIVQDFTAGRAFWNMVLPLVVFIGGILGIFMVGDLFG